MPAYLSATPRSSARLFGIPFGNLGFFASLLIAVALGFMTFFGTTFLSIFGLLIYDRAGHHQVGLDASYKFIALPAGLLVLTLSLVTLLGFWLRNKMSAQHREG